jgi:GNAT superfamily N-acetyltransferase
LPEAGLPTLHRLDPTRRADFFRLHSAENGCGLCLCVAWWVPTWDGWGDRTPAMNRLLRQDLFARGHDDGYLAYFEDEPVGWIQVGPRDRLEKLVHEYRLPREPETWAITCLLVAPRARGRGLARFLVAGVLADLPQRGAAAVEAFPRTGEGLPAEDVWTGPETLFLSLGFSRVQDHPRRPRYRLNLPAGAASV